VRAFKLTFRLIKGTRLCSEYLDKCEWSMHLAGDYLHRRPNHRHVRFTTRTGLTPLTNSFFLFLARYLEGFKIGGEVPCGLFDLPALNSLQIIDANLTGRIHQCNNKICKNGKSPLNTFILFETGLRGPLFRYFSIGIAKRTNTSADPFSFL